MSTFLTTYHRCHEGEQGVLPPKSDISFKYLGFSSINDVCKRGWPHPGKGSLPGKISGYTHATYSPVYGEKAYTIKVNAHSPNIGEYVHTLKLINFFPYIQETSLRLRTY